MRTLWRPLGDENDKAFALVNALSADQRKQAVLGVEVRNLVLGPGADGKVIQPEGVRVSSFTPNQRTMLGVAREQQARADEQRSASARLEGHRPTMIAGLGQPPARLRDSG